MRIRNATGFAQQAFRRTFVNARVAAPGDFGGDGSTDLYIVQGCHEQNDPDALLLNDGSGLAFSDVPIPLTSEGCGDTAAAIDVDRSGLDDIVVLNGRGFIHGVRVYGPIQLITLDPPS